MPVDTGEEESMFSMAEQCTVAKILSAHLVVPGGVIVDIRVALNAFGSRPHQHRILRHLIWLTISRDSHALLKRKNRFICRHSPHFYNFGIVHTDY